MDAPWRQLVAFVRAHRPIIYIPHYDFLLVDQLLTRLFTELAPADLRRYGHEDDLERFLTDLDDLYTGDRFVVLRDVHAQLDDPRVLVRLKRLVEQSTHRGANLTIFVVSSKLVIPEEIEKLVVVWELPKPSREEVLQLIRSHDIATVGQTSEQTIAELATAFQGLDHFEVQQILDLAYAEVGALGPQTWELVWREKVSRVKQTGLLEFVEVKDLVSRVAGMDALMGWLKEQAEMFRRADEALAMGLELPKGVVIVGMPGCGKSLSAKAAAELFNLPLLRFDLGRVLGKYVGESEKNMKKALEMASALSPCVLWIDEVEKAFSGLGSAGEGSPVTTRMLGTFLTWLQEKKEQVFVVLTANDVTLPPELTRKGRFDEVYFVDLPNDEERRQIFGVHLARANQDAGTLLTPGLVRATREFSGADIESVVQEARRKAFLSGKKLLTPADLLEAVHATRPLAVIQKDKMEAIRKALTKLNIRKANGSGPPASAPSPAAPVTPVRRLLAQEVTKTNGAITRSVVYTYDQAGRLLSDRHQWTEYDGETKVMESVYDCDARGRKVRRVDSLSYEMRYEYDQWGNLCRTYEAKQGSGKWWTEYRYEYTANGLLRLSSYKSEDGSWEEYQYDYDDRGNKVRSRRQWNNGSSTEEYRYDQKNRQISCQGNDGYESKYAYFEDGDGRVAKAIYYVRGSQKHVTEYTYEFAYDGQVTREIARRDDGEVTTREFLGDQLVRVLTERPGELSSTEYQHGQVVREQKAEGQIDRVADLASLVVDPMGAANDFWSLVAGSDLTVEVKTYTYIEVPDTAPQRTPTRR